MQRVRVLVVDDEPTFRDLVARLLEKSTVCECRAVESGFEVAAALRDFKPHLVLLDVVLPGADGFAVCRVIKSDPATAHIPVVLMTGLVVEEMQARHRAVGASDMLVKPFTAGELHRVVLHHARSDDGPSVVGGGDASDEGFLTRLAAVQVEEVERSARAALDRPAGPAPERGPSRLSVEDIGRLMTDLDPSLAGEFQEFAETDGAARLRVTVSPDRMTATLLLSRRGLSGRPPAKEDALRKLAELGVTHGIDEAAVDALVARHARDGERAEGIVARGMPPAHGHDTRLELQGLAVRERPPATPGEVVDHRASKVLPFARAGEAVATIIPHEAGADGFDIFGTPLPAAVGTRRQVRVGKGAILSDDGKKVFAKTTGFVFHDELLVDVRDCYVHEGDVGIESGNLQFEGDLVVNGTVRGGFSVSVGGNLRIAGGVERAVVRAGGDLSIQGGVTGAVDSPALLSCGGRFEALYVENAEVVAGGDVLVADAVVHARLFGGDLVEVSGRRGKIIGGEVSARVEVACMEAGAPGGAETALCAGEDPVARGRMREVEKTLAELAGKMKIVQRLVDGMKRRGITPELLHLMQENPNIRDFLANYGKMRDEFTRLAAERALLSSGMVTPKHVSVRVLGRIHPNVRIRLKGASLLNREELANAQFTIGPEGEIVHG